MSKLIRSEQPASCFTFCLDYSGVYDVVMEDCEIGDDVGSSPWAIKYKSHQQYVGTLRNHTYRRLRVGRIASNSYQQPHGGYFMSIGTSPTSCCLMCAVFR